MQAAPSAEIALRLLPWFLAVQVGAYAGAAVVGLLPTLFLSARMFLAGIAGFSSGAAMGAVVIAAAFLATSIGPAGFLMFPLALVLPAAVAGYLLVRFGGCGIEAKR
jgi:hypothetical protein